MSPASNTICEYCGSVWPEWKQLNGHKISCSKNPKSAERNKRVSRGKMGKPRSEEAKAKISATMKEIHAKKRALKAARGQDVSISTVPLSVDGTEIDILVMDDDMDATDLI